MIRCTNKVFLMELLGSNQVATPPTVLLADAGDLPRAMDELGLPLVVNIPDGWGHPLAAPRTISQYPFGCRNCAMWRSCPIWGSWWAAPPTARRKLILELNGEDSACCRLKSEAKLARLLMRSDWIRFVEHVNGDGAIVFEHVCKLGLEGIVSKRRDLPYSSGSARRAAQAR